MKKTRPISRPFHGTLDKLMKTIQRLAPLDELIKTIQRLAHSATFLPKPSRGKRDTETKKKIQ